ncbi:protein distal antenna [Bicyclus anynana]|uniref:Protein distal antenna n=1 Tax=Bicyclus anynana TaxID=110368 RepID=A0A6J1N0X7_BICAN|nr:protein distal antenna [Bicyclus anynana]
MRGELIALIKCGGRSPVFTARGVRGARRGRGGAGGRRTDTKERRGRRTADRGWPYHHRHTVAARAPRRTYRAVPPPEGQLPTELVLPCCVIVSETLNCGTRAAFAHTCIACAVCAVPCRLCCGATAGSAKIVNTTHVPARKKREAKMTTKGKRPMRALTPGDKIEAIQRVNDGESKASVARDIGVPESTLRGWCKNEDKLRYMTSRLSSPDTDKSNDGEPPDKRARTESPTAPQSPVATGLDLSSPAAVTHNAPLPVLPTDAPVELTTKRSEPSPPVHPPRERRPDPGASVSMSAISPLSGLAHLPGLTHSHLGLSFNEIATNLTLLAQLNPGLSALSAQPASRALRSVRSPKPVHNGVLNLNETKHRSKSSHSSDPYRHSGSKSSHHLSSQSSAAQPVDDTLWYWLKTQQAMLDLTAQSTAAHPLQLGKASDPTLPPKPVAPTPPVTSHLDYNRNSWLWQYYKQFGGAMPLPEDKLKSASQVPKEKSGDNILYSHLTKSKTEEDRGATSPPHGQIQPVEVRETAPVPEEPRATEPPVNHEVENKEPTTTPIDTGKSQTKVRNVLDNLLYSSGQVAEESKSNGHVNGEWESGTAAALEHGDKFLAWLEASGDPSVTRMHVHQLRALLHNLRTRRHAPAAAPDAARRK